jgi:hypothetical protein
MGCLRLAAIIALFVAAGAAAHETPIPGDEDDYLPWHLVAENADRAVFVAVTRRVDHAATLASMIVYRAVQEDDGETRDAEAHSVLVDCRSKRFEVSDTVTVLKGAQNPPPMVRIASPAEVTDPESANDLSAPPPGTVQLRMLEIGCGEDVAPGARIANPYRWARERFGLPTRPRRRR